MTASVSFANPNLIEAILTTSYILCLFLQVIVREKKHKYPKYLEQVIIFLSWTALYPPLLLQKDIDLIFLL